MELTVPASAEPLSFGALLKRYRVAAGLSQEELAERARLSVRAISSHERGLHHAPHRDTVALLVEALELSPPEAATMEAAVPRRRGTATALSAGEVPTSTWTFLLTDIEGSSGLWEQHPRAMRAALVRHDALLAELLARYGGRQVRERGEGDSVFAVFASPAQALAAACAVQRALLAEPWPSETPLRVRVGLHSGEAEPREGSYYGPAVNRTARLRALAHGSQILLSQATRDLVQDSLPEGVSLRSLGVHGLAGLQCPEQVYQLLHPALPGEFPPLAGSLLPRHNLPQQLTSFVGRKAEQGEVLAALEGSRLVTLTGTGGVGKTRLALAVAGALLEAYPDGVWLVELAALAEPALVARTMAEALGLREEPGRTMLESLTGHLKGKRLLLVLDNCEHLVGDCAAVTHALLHACTGLRVLATSRQRLGVAGERVYRVSSLSMPDPRYLPALELVPAYEAVRLFVERAREQRAGFVFDARNAATVAQICGRLDGIPLAIELAAARIALLGVEAIAARLADCFRLLTGGPRTAPPRQQTLRASVDWSHQLLCAQERALLRRLAVFAGSWTLEAAETVCAVEEIKAGDVLELLTGLAERSLVQVEERGEEVRYRLLETVRQYGLQQLIAAGEDVLLRKRHLDWCLAQVDEKI